MIHPCSGERINYDQKLTRLVIDIAGIFLCGTYSAVNKIYEIMKKILVGVLLLIAISGYSQTWTEGYYYDKSGEKHAGMIKHFPRAGFDSGPDNSIYFRTSENDKSIHLTSEDISAFVIKSDSFCIVKDFSINPFAHYTHDFAKVIIPGKLSLLLHYTTIAYNTTPYTSYLVSKDGLTVSIKNNNNLRNNLPNLISDYPELVAKIERGEYRIIDIKSIINDYNSQFSN